MDIVVFLVRVKTKPAYAFYIIQNKTRIKVVWLTVVFQNVCVGGVFLTLKCLVVVCVCVTSNHCSGVEFNKWGVMLFCLGCSYGMGKSFL